MNENIIPILANKGNVKSLKIVVLNIIEKV